MLFTSLCVETQVLYQSVWDLWWTQWQWRTYFSNNFSLFCQKSSVHSICFQLFDDLYHLRCDPAAKPHIPEYLVSNTWPNTPISMQTLSQ